MPTKNETYARDQAIRDHYLRPRDNQYKTTAGQARNVIGVGLGKRIRGGNTVDEQCVRLYVEKKVVPLQAVDEPFRIPQMLNGIPTDVIETRRFISFDDVYAPGASIGVDYDAPNVPLALDGTLSAIVKVGNIWYALGSNHVMALNGRVPHLRRIMFRPPEKFIVDPRDFIFAQLAAWVELKPEGPDYDPGKPNTVDCALAIIEKPDRVTGEFPGRIADSSDIVEPEPDDRVARVDESDEATGIIEQVGARVRIDYRFGTFDFDDMVLIKGIGGAFASPGDSGALVVGLEGKKKGKPIAMIVGGSQTYAIACKLSNVRDALKSELQRILPLDHQPEDDFELVLQKLDDHVRAIEGSVKGLFEKIAAYCKDKLHLP